MTTKQYNIWNSENIYQAPATRNLKTDYWSTLTKATLTWTVSGTAGFDNIQVNGETVGLNSNGSADVTTIVKNGQNNNITLNYRCDWGTIILGQAAGNARVYLTVTGILATYEIVLAQNAGFKTALQNGQITQADYLNAMAFQNNVLQQLLALDLITAEQYQTAIQAQNIPSNGTGGNGETVIIDNGTSNGGTSQTPLIIGAVLVAVFLGIAYMWYTGAAQ
jgi:hypothetical protein